MAPYLPIRKATLHLTFLFLFVSVAIVGFGLARMNVTPQDTTMPPLAGTGLFLALVGTLCSVGMVFTILWSHPECDGNMFKWTRHFVDRNRVGYVLWCVRREDGNAPPYSYPIDYYVTKRDEIPSEARDARVALGIPLNGGTVQLKSPHLDQGQSTKLDIRVRWFNFPGETVVLRVEDSEGDRVTVSHGSFLEITNGVSVGNGACNLALTKSWSSVVGAIILDKQRDGSLLADRDAAVADLHETIVRIDATKRFGRSSQAMEIRAWLQTRFAVHEAVRPVVLPGQFDT